MKAHLLTTEEERKLLKAIQKKGAGCDEMKKLELAIKPFVVNLAKQYKNKGFAFGDLIDLGIAGLQQAAMKYDLESDTRFLICGVWEIQQAMIQAIKGKK